MQFGHDAMPLGSAQVVGVDLGDDERHVGIHAEGRGVVDDERARGGGTRRPLERERVVDVDDDEVEAVEAVVAQHLAHDLAAHERQAAAERTLRGEGAQLRHRERALLEDAQHLLADETGRADHADLHGHGVLETERGAGCAPRARRRSRARRTRSGSSTC